MSKSFLTLKMNCEDPVTQIILNYGTLFFKTTRHIPEDVSTLICAASSLLAADGELSFVYVRRTQSCDK